MILASNGQIIITLIKSRSIMNDNALFQKLAYSIRRKKSADLKIYLIDLLKLRVLL